MDWWLSSTVSATIYLEDIVAEYNAVYYSDVVEENNSDI